DKKNDRLRDFLGGFLPACVLIGIIAGLIVLEPDFGGAFLIILIGFSLFFVAGVNIKHIIGISLFSLPAIISFLLVDYRRDRLISFLDPWSYQETSGYQLIQSLIAVGSGGIFGKGLGNSTQKLYFLPEIHTDFIYAGIAEELGFIGSVFILMLFVILFIFCVDSTLKQKDNFRFLLTFGCTLVIVLPALFHILAVLGLVPTKGLTLTFVSYGGSSLIMNMFIIGVILRGLKENRCV
ncbi:MAG: FtsW/RodA/SpoVE family cell cycle protein, partial [Deferribacterota bacterium]|nr:FtsW/RodA/SpoVE family cell cycle protein [Deferribacterota bacterium]